MLFCPTCANLLLIEKTVKDLRFFCKTCPYVFVVEENIVITMQLERKEVDDIFGGKEAWKDVDVTSADCPLCQHPKAYFMQK